MVPGLSAQANPTWCSISSERKSEFARLRLGLKSKGLSYCQPGVIALTSLV
jgi:hypothetical protein